jgi:uncharacterized protein
VEPTLDGGSVSIDLRGIQEGTHSLVLDGREKALVVDEEADRVLRGFRFEGDLSYDGRNYRVRGSLSGTLETACDRCLTRFGRPVRADVEVRAVPHDSPSVGADDEDETDGTMVLLGSERRLDLGSSLRAAVLLEVPIKNVCRTDCLGICPVCGADRNLESCDCSPTAGDPRWDALRGITFPSDPEE